MTASFSCPDWLEARALDDAAMGRAYESLDAQSRAVLKTCIARLHRIWGESADRDLSLHCPRQGFCLEREDRPAETAVIVCTAGYRHPTAFLAALMPAVLAGVRAVLPFFVPLPDADQPSGAARLSGRGPETGLPRGGPVLPAAPLLAALELAGVEKAYPLDEEAVLAFVREIRPESGRLLLLGERPFARDLILYAHSAGLACRSFFRPARYWSDRLGRAATLGFTAGQVPPAFGEKPSECGEERPEPDVRLDAAHEDLWIWPDLDPGWFRVRRVRLFGS